MLENAEVLEALQPKRMKRLGCVASVSVEPGTSAESIAEITEKVPTGFSSSNVPKKYHTWAMHFNGKLIPKELLDQYFQLQIIEIVAFLPGICSNAFSTMRCCK